MSSSKIASLKYRSLSSGDSSSTLAAMLAQTVG